MYECSGNGAYNSSFILGPWRRFPYPPTDAHLSQPVDNDTSELVDKVLTEVGHLESIASKMDINNFLRCGNEYADYCRI